MNAGRAVLAAAGLLALACAAGCASSAPADGAAPNAAAVRAAAAAPLAGAAAGVRVLGWTVDPDLDVASVLARGLPPDAIVPVVGDDEARRLARNGLAVVRVSASTVDALRGALGVARSEQDLALGQAASWRELRSIRHPSRGLGVVVDGRVRRFDPGVLELLGRGWIVPMEDGPRVQAELRAAHRADDPRAGLRRGGTRREERPRAIEPVDLAFLLEAGETIMVLPVDPGGPIPGVTADEPATRRSTLGRRAAVDPAPGPPVESPRTLGARLLDGGRGAKVILVLQAVIPAELGPPPLPRELAVRLDLEAAGGGRSDRP